MSITAIAVREMIVCNLRSLLDLEAKNRAADLLLVPRLLPSDFPGARDPFFREITWGVVLWRL